VPSGAVETGQVRSISFPVAGPVSYVNDFGACRDGCSRAHQGNDLIGDRLQPLLAMHDGVIDHLVDHLTAGYGVVIRDAEGWEYRIYHVNNDTPGTDDGADDGTWRFAQGIAPATTVRAGQLIGWMGDSGNSEGSVPHAHVEIHRPDGVAINPYWSLRAAQRDLNCSITTIDTVAELPGDSRWLGAGWETAPLPKSWMPLRLTGGHPASDIVAARMWIGAPGYTPVDAAALRVGDLRYDNVQDCTRPSGVTPGIPSELGAVLATIRAIESGGDYTAESTTSSASGAYQFIDSNWGGYGGFARASHAPPAVQDAKAAEWAGAILARNGGDVSTLPVTWYLGHVPVGSEWDTVPPQGGNRLTPRDYQDLWMRQYTALLGQPEAWAGVSGWTPIDISQTCHTVVVNLGPADALHYVLTQAQRFAADPTGRAVPSPVDPCDPARAAPAPTPTDASGTRSVV
jgi:hypothetical protein